MKHSKYNYLLKHKEWYYVFNGFSGVCVALSENEYRDFQAQTCLKQDLLEYIRLGFVVEDNVDETAQYLSMLKEENQRSSKRFYRILTTTDCNAHCFYCYEKGVPIQTMDDRTANDVADFIIRQQQGVKRLFLQWFGGEPLCNTQVIDIIADKLTNVGLDFQSSMTTNGLLFDDILARKAKDKWNVNKVQITLDGTKCVYEKIKSFEYPNAFERVIANIHALSAVGIKISIRVNYAEKTKNDILELIAFLSSEYAKDKNISVYAYRLFDDEKNLKTDEEIFACLEKNGFISQKEKEFPDLVLNPCMARRTDSLVVLPNGNLAKCSRGLQLKNGIIGNIYQRESFSGDWEYLNPDCVVCKHLPICGGGCKCEEFMKENFCTLNEEEINKKLFDLIKTKEIFL